MFTTNVDKGCKNGDKQPQVIRRYHMQSHVVHTLLCSQDVHATAIIIVNSISKYSAVVENGVYNFVQFGNCSFIGNTAREYASAIVFNTLDPIRQVEHVNPTTITDW